MKKTILILASAGALITGMVSCHKQDMHEPRAAIHQTIDVTLDPNQSYSYVLTQNLRDDEYRFTTQAQHASSSVLSVNSSNQRIYTYTPANGFTGTDQVVLSNDWERQEHMNNCMPPPPQGPKKRRCNKGGGEEDHYIVTINFTIKDQQVTTEKKQ